MDAPTIEPIEQAPVNNSIDQNPCSNIVSNEQSFDISFKNKLFSIEISTGKKDLKDMKSLRFQNLYILKIILQMN